MSRRLRFFKKEKAILETIFFLSLTTTRYNSFQFSFYPVFLHSNVSYSEHLVLPFVLRLSLFTSFAYRRIIYIHTLAGET